MGPGHHEIKGEIGFLLKNIITLSNKESLFSLKTFLHPEYFYSKNTNYYNTLICIGLNQRMGFTTPFAFLKDLATYI